MDQDLLTIIKQGFSAIYERLAKMDERFEGMEKRFDGMEKRFDASDKRSDTMEERIATMEARFTQQLQEFRQETTDRFENLDTEVRQVHIVVEGLHGKVQLTAEGITNVNEKLDRHRDEVSQKLNDLESLVRSSDRALASRVSDMEKKVKLAS